MQVFVLMKDYTLLQFRACENTVIEVEDDDWTVYQQNGRKKDHIANLPVAEVISIGFTRPDISIGYRRK